jgi:hypothetical protein
VEPSHHRRGWHGDCGDPAGHGGGGGAAVPDLVKKDAKRMWRRRRMVLRREGWSWVAAQQMW